MIQRMFDLIREMDTCVLATLRQGRPYCSLMGYFPDEGCRRIYMMTDRTTTKYSNISDNPNVCILIDTRERQKAKAPSETLALTVSGICRVVSEKDERDAALMGLLKRHPDLAHLAGSPSAEILCVDISSLLLLEGIEKSYFAEL
jgi:nitroimidazol reductase NimA-like FMN-containing flavoprotein (pyridoxamine 5'-phosphate oxidase superfamily)